MEAFVGLFVGGQKQWRSQAGTGIAAGSLCAGSWQT